MELGEKTKYVLGLPGGTQIGLEHGEKKPRDHNHQPADPPPADRGQRFNGFFKASLIGFANWKEYLKRKVE